MTEAEYCARIEALKSRLYRTALLYLGGEADAVDAVDECVYKGLLSYKKVREEACFNTWATRILINVCHDELRRRKREEPAEFLPEESAEAFDALPLRDAIGRLSPELREVVVLRFFSGLTLAETARALDIPQGTVATRQRKALALLRLELGEEGDA